MKLDKFLSGSAISAVAVSMLYSAPAMAAGTQAGTTITNNVTVSYQVSGVDQNDATASNDIVVDRKVDLTVAHSDNTATQVTPGAVNQAVTFQVTNTSNDTLDFALSAAQVVTGGAAGIAGDANDSFDVGALTFYLDDGDCVFDSGDTLITHLDAVAPDTSRVVHVVGATVPSGLSTNAIASVVLTATARTNDAAATLGAALVQAATNTAGVDTIFADGAGSTDSARDASYSAKDDYKVFAAAITATKSSKIVSGDYGTGAAIPGAKIEYCIAVANAAGGAAASNLTISDTLPGQVTYDATYGVKVGGADCNTPGGTAGSQSSGVVSGTIASLAAGSTQTLIFRADIN
jgi:uncharacterized repeat protein (TIGR01451 family)